MGKHYDEFYDSLQDPRVTSQHYVELQGYLKIQKTVENQVVRRKKRVDEPPTPTTADQKIDFGTSNKYTHVSIDGELEEFLVINEYYQELGGPIVVFIALKFIRQFLTATLILADGTFKTTPDIFCSIKGQLWGLHFLFLGKLFTAVHCFLPGKNKEVYDKVRNTINIIMC